MQIAAERIAWSGEQAIRQHGIRQHGIEVPFMEESSGWTGLVQRRLTIPVVITIHGPWRLADRDRLFRVRDGIFAEDACRVRPGQAPRPGPQALAHRRDGLLTLIRKRRLKPKPAREAFAADPKAAIRAIMRA